MSNQRYTVTRKPLQQIEATPAHTRITEEGTLFLDFGKAAFGTLVVPFAGTAKEGRIVVHLGEQLTADGRVESSPAGTIRYIRIEQEISPDEAGTRIVIPPDKRNTGPAAIKMPPEIGEVFPFRYAEIEDTEGVDAAAVRQIRVQYPFDDGASAFSSSDGVLNGVWDLCKYSIKATTFCGVYVDGDRERIPYDGDAYINQLGHYAVDSEYALARYTHEYLIQNPTWPTEWHLHSVMMAWADYLYTGETSSLEEFYEDLCAKTLIELARPDGLISTASECRTVAFEKRLHMHGETYLSKHGLRDLVDWPPGSFTEGGTGERDNHEMLPVNTVVNAFHAHALKLMSHIAGALGRSDDQRLFADRADVVCDTLNQLLFDETRGCYIDGEGSQHASLHSNMFMLAFDLVPDARKAPVVAFVKSRGMACSVYGAQYLLEALYLNGEEDAALELMTAKHDRGWWHMIELGTTITWEAWDLKYKKNLDWNHAWGAAPANILPRFLLGVRPLEPGFRKVLIHPQPGALAQVSGTVPSPKGPISVSLSVHPSGQRKLEVNIPGNVRAKGGLKQGGQADPTLLVDGKPVSGFFEGDALFVDNLTPGFHELVYNTQCIPATGNRTLCPQQTRKPE
ncbi:MAG: alpha-L-rhamnosidase [Kiritimatiellae bacterium]|nr:alpha-L-rhamnosidase [Kiritimatiellia bacterium]